MNAIGVGDIAATAIEQHKYLPMLRRQATRRAGDHDHDGVWEAIWAELHVALPERMGREASPRLRFSTANRSGRQKRGGRGSRVGYDAGKQAKGRMIHALVDSERAADAGRRPLRGDPGP